MSHDTTGLRALSILAGVGLLGATAHLTILGLGGYSEPHTYLVIAMAVATAIGGLTISGTISEKRYALALCIAVGLLSGEGYGLISTGERVISERDAKQAPIRAAQKAHDDAKAALRDARAAKAKLDERVVGEAAKKDCVKNCRALLEQQIATAKADITNAETALADAPAPDASASALADRTGFASWKIDIFTAILAALGGNVLGAAMIVAGAHSGGAGDTLRAPELEAKPLPRIIVSDEPADNRPKVKAAIVCKPIAQLPANVIDFRSHPVVRALENIGGSVSSNRELARLMAVSEGEASKRWREIEDRLEIVRVGKQLRIGLRA